MQHQQAHELLEAYSLGMVEEPELSQLKAHLDTCRECRAHLRKLSELSAIMAESLPQHDPPAAIEERLVNRVRSDATSGATSSGGWWGRVGWIAAAAAAIVAVFFGLEHRSVKQQIAAAQSELDGYRSQMDKLEADLAAYEDATLLLGQPGMQFIDLAGVAPNGQAFGKVVVDPDVGTGVVYMYELPPTPEGMEYQLWVLRDGQPTSAGTFTVAADGSAVLNLNALPDMSRIASFDVTIEPAGGQPEPTGMMYLTGAGTHQFNR